MKEQAINQYELEFAHDIITLLCHSDASGGRLEEELKEHFEAVMNSERPVIFFDICLSRTYIYACVPKSLSREYLYLERIGEKELQKRITWDVCHLMEELWSEKAMTGAGLTEEDIGYVEFLTSLLNFGKEEEEKDSATTSEKMDETVAKVPSASNSSSPIKRKAKTTAPPKASIIKSSLKRKPNHIQKKSSGFSSRAIEFLKGMAQKVFGKKKTVTFNAPSPRRSDRIQVKIRKVSEEQAQNQL